MDKKVTFTFIVVALLACILLLERRISNKHDKLTVPALVITPDTLYAGQGISFADTAMAATKYEWDFGDQSGSSSDQSGTHQYINEGRYTVRLKYNMNDSIVYDKTIVVLSKPVNIDTAQFDIAGPVQGYEKQPLTFKAIVSDKAATLFEWRFGETGAIDSHEKNPTYTFSKPDVYEISLRVNNSSRFVKRNVTIVARTTKPAPQVSPETLEGLFQEYLGAHDDEKHDALKRSIVGYFCGLNSTVVKDKNAPESSLKDFLRNIDLLGRSSVRVITISRDKITGCINLIEVQTK